MQKVSSRNIQNGFFRRYLMLLLMIVFGYLSQVCIMPYIRIFGVVPNLLYVIIGVVTVAYGKLRAFWVGTIFGLLMEIMLPSVPFLNLGLYTVSTLFCSFAFADKPLKTLEYERATNHTRKELAPWLRTMLCTTLNIFIFETVHITYIYLDGSPILFSHLVRGFIGVFLTAMLCLLLEYPLRRLIFGPGYAVRIMRSAPVVFSKR